MHVVLGGQTEERAQHNPLKKKAHANIGGNDLADVAAELAVTSNESLPSIQVLKVDFGEIAPPPPSTG